MLKKLIATLAMSLASFAACALQPYIGAEKVAAGDLNAAMMAVEKKLSGAGFTVVGKHMPKGIAAGTIIVTDATLTDAAKAAGGTNIVVAPVRVGVKADGTVSYLNMEYWLRAMARADYGKVEAAGKSVAAKLQKALGAGQPFGGDVPADALAEYRYMFGMERFNNRSEIKEFKNFDEALKTVRDNLAKGVQQTSKVYEVVAADKQVAVIGFAQNSAEKGEAWWVNKIEGVDHVAALPWEVFIVGGQVYGLHGRFRTALAWPSLKMGQFMGIGQHPDYVLQMVEDIAGVK